MTSSSSIFPALPSSWNRDPSHKSKFLRVPDESSVDLMYYGPGRTDFDAATCRANVSVNPCVSMYYYEVTIVSKGVHGYIGIGFCGESVPLGRLPGWEPNSFGYHGDDGNKFSGHGTGKHYGPKFTTGDIVGCIYNAFDRTISYTKNGSFLGLAFEDIPSSLQLFPCVGLRTAREHIKANFGGSNSPKFRFDFGGFCGSFIASKLLSIVQPSPSSSGNSRYETVNFLERALPELVLEHLAHGGYKKSVEAFVEHCISSTRDSNSTLKTDSENPSIVVDHSPGSGPSTLSTFRSFPLQPEDLGRLLSDIEFRNDIKGIILNGNVASAKDIINLHFPNLLDEELGVKFSLETQILIERIADLIECRQFMSTSDSNSMRKQADDNESSSAKMLESILRLGTKLISEFADQSEEFEQYLINITSLLAYSDPISQSAPHASFLTLQHRARVASLVNAAVLRAQGHRPFPILEKVMSLFDELSSRLISEDSSCAGICEMCGRFLGHIVGFERPRDIKGSLPFEAATLKECEEEKVEGRDEMNGFRLHSEYRRIMKAAKCKVTVVDHESSSMNNLNVESNNASMESLVASRRDRRTAMRSAMREMRGSDQWRLNDSLRRQRQQRRTIFDDFGEEDEDDIIADEMMHDYMNESIASVTSEDFVDGILGPDNEFLFAGSDNDNRAVLVQPPPPNVQILGDGWEWFMNRGENASDEDGDDEDEDEDEDEDIGDVNMVT